MRSGQPSLTAQWVARYRLGFERLETAFGDPEADIVLSRDVAGNAVTTGNEAMARYLRGRTAFFDRVTVEAIDRGVDQIVLLGAGYDGRAVRYAKPGVRWWEVDHPSTQADKRSRLDRLGIAVGDVGFVPMDLEDGGLAHALVGAGFDAGVPSLFICEGVVVYLTSWALACLLTDTRSLSTPETRLAISALSAPAEGDQGRTEGLWTALAALGEPAIGTRSPAEWMGLLAQAGWRPVTTSEAAERAGLVLAFPISRPASEPPSDQVR